MVKKKNNTARRRKKSNTSTNEGAKRSKTEENNPAEYRNGILHGLRVILGKMGDKDLLSVMGYVSTMEAKQKSTTIQPSMTVTATATEQATVMAIQNSAVEAANLTTTTTTEGSANPTTTTATVPPVAGNPTTTATVPPSPPEDPTLIQLNKYTKVPPHNIVTIDPRCFHCDGITEVAASKHKNKSINTIVNAIVQNNLTPQQRALALKQAMVHPNVRALAKSAGIIDDQDVIKKITF